MSEKTKQFGSAKQILSLYWKHTKPYKKELAIIYPAMVLAQIIEDFLQPLVISFVITKLAAGDIAGLRASNIPLILGAVAASELVGHLLWNRLVVPKFWRTQDKIMSDLNMTAFNHLQRMSTSFFNDRFAGSLVNQVNKFVGSFERLTDALTWNVFKLIVSVIATAIILAPTAPLVSVAIGIISVVYIPIAWRYRKQQLPFNKAWAASETDRTGQLADTVSNILAVKSFSGEGREQKRMQEKVDIVHERSMDTMKITMKQELVTGLLQRSINVAVVVVSILLALNGNINVGVIYLSLTFTIGIMRRLWDLNNTFRAFTRVFGDAHDMAEILAIEPAVADKKSSANISLKDSSVDFSDVTFGHEENKAPLFKNLNLNIKPGQKIGLVGMSGGGKTTITKLLLRFMDIQGGTISIGGVDITDMPQSELRKHVSYVPQEPLLFHRSLADNIAYGKPDATKAEIEKISKLAHAHEFINELPEKYTTLVGERGVKLSGGQRQRIAIARAMIKNAPILLLDEATSALDSESETLIQDALKKLMKGRTTIVIAHRLSTIQKLDRIIVLEEGKIIEEGSHKNLLEENGTYAKLWAHQSGGFLDE
jgi:ATP-binding cassette subfamily B protein